MLYSSVQIMHNIAALHFNYQIHFVSNKDICNKKYEMFIFNICLGILFFFRIKVLLAFWTWDQKDQDTHAPKGLFGYLLDCWLQVKVNMATSLFLSSIRSWDCTFRGYAPFDIRLGEEEIISYISSTKHVYL